MPRYFFDIRDGEDVLDEEGEPLSDDAEACTAALQTLGEVLLSRQDRFYDDGRLEVRVRAADHRSIVRLEVRRIG